MFKTISSLESLETFSYIPSYPFVDPDWLKVWSKHFPQHLKIDFYQEEGIFLALPWIVRQQGWRSYELLNTPIFDYSDILSQGDYIPALSRYFQEITADAVLLKRVRDDSHLWPFIQSIAGRSQNFHTIIRPAVNAPYILIQGSWQNYLQTLRKKFVADTLRQKKRWEGLGGFSFEVAKTPESVRTVTQALFDQHIDRRKAMGQNRSIFERSVYQEFFLALNEVLLAKGRLFLCYLRLNDKIVAVAQCFVYGRKLYYYLPAFDDAYKAYSPGNVLIYHILQFAFENGYQEVDLMAGEEGYKKNWNATPRSVYNIEIYKKSLGGSLAMAQGAFNHTLGQMKARLANSPVKNIKQQLFRLRYRYDGSSKT